MQPFKPTLIAFSAGAMLAGAAGVEAAGFALIESSASGMGSAFAGAAASAEDASTIYFNPAGMTFLPGAQVVAAGHGVNVHAECTNCTSTRPLALGGGANTGGTGGDAGGLAFVPNLYLSTPIGKRVAIGLGVNVPFGLRTEYDDSWVGRFQGIQTELQTINVNPSIALKATETFSIGAGVSYQSADATLTNAVVLPVTQTVFTEGRAKLELDGTAWGWNLGALWQLSPDMRIGASYRSQMNYALDGTTTVTALNGTPVNRASGPTRVDVKLPDMASLSVMQTFGDKWTLLGDVTYTWWDKIGELNAINTTNGTYRDKLAFNFDNAWRVSFGVTYVHSAAWKFRGGLAWDQSPVKDDTRTVRLPDNDRYWVALGAQWRLNKRAAIDIAYAHLFIPDANIDYTRGQVLPSGASFPGTATTVTGRYDGSVDILSLQLTWTF